MSAKSSKKKSATPPARRSEVDLTSERQGPIWRVYLRALGPGLVTGASDDDPSGIATYAQAGAHVSPHGSRSRDLRPNCARHRYGAW